MYNYNIYGDIMFTDMENLKLIDIMRRPASKRREFKGRLYHGFVFKISGESIYYFKNKELIHKAGELLFIPKGEIYNLRCLCQNSEYLLINFDADIKDAKVTKYSLDTFFEADYLYENLEKLWIFGDVSGKYKCLSKFYEIISFVSHKHDTDFAAKKNFAKISKAVKYMEEHIFDCNLKVGKLPLMCNMSDTYFRKIFRANYGLNPAEYISQKRLARAKHIILSGDYDSIAEVAYLSGFEDPLYFSRVFKTMYKVSPSEYHSID